MPASPRSRLSLFLEFAVVLGVLIGSKLIFDQIVWKYAGPLSLLCTLGTILLFTRHYRENWSRFGLIRLRRWWSWPLIVPQAALGIIGILGIGAGTAFLGDALGFWTTDGAQAGVTDRWGNIPGNLPVYLGWLAIAWISAGLGEEVFFRGFVIDRLSRLLPDARWAVPVAVLLAAVGFGIAHMYYQGVRGLVVTGMIGLVLGSLYILYKRNLWPLIVAHGCVDTLVFTAMYMEWDI
jgi:hypothetical protein